MKRFIDFKQIKREVGIRRILEHYGHLPELIEQGDRLSGTCPIWVSQEKNCFKCFSCDAGGNILDLVRLMEDCSIREAAEKIADWFGIECGRRRSRTPRKAAGQPVACRQVESTPASPKLKEGPPCEATQAARATEPPQAPAERASDGDAGATSPVNPPLSFELKLNANHPWFEEHGIRPETVEKFGLGYCSKGMMRGRIAFPIRNSNGELIGYAGLWAEAELPGDQPRWKFPAKLALDEVVYPAELLGGQGLEAMLVATDPFQVVLAYQLGIEKVVFFPGNCPRPANLRAISITTPV